MQKTPNLKTKSLFKLEKPDSPFEQHQKKISGLFLNSYTHTCIYLRIYPFTNTYMIAHCFSPMGMNTAKRGDSQVLPAHIRGNLLPNSTRVSSVQETGSGNGSPDCSRVISTISQSGGQPNPILGHPPAPSCQNKEVSGWKLHPPSRRRHVPMDHRPIDPFPTTPASRRLPPGRSPAPRGSQGLGVSSPSHGSGVWSTTPDPCRLSVS